MPSLLLTLSLSLSSAAFSQISWSLSSLSPHSHLISLKIVISLCLNCSPKAIILCPTSTLWPVLWHSAPECLFPFLCFFIFFNYSTKKSLFLFWWPSVSLSTGRQPHSIPVHQISACLVLHFTESEEKREVFRPCVCVCPSPKCPWCW